MLLGAGSSIPAGYPSTRSLTDRILLGAGVWRHTDETYHFADELPDDPLAKLACRFARYLMATAKQYHAVRTGRYPNYEDLFFLADQASQEMSGESENPAIAKFLDELHQAAVSLLPDEPDLSVQGLVTETRHYIADAVWQSLDQDPARATHLEPLVHACATGHVHCIATLCHDTHTERYLRARALSLADGFSADSAGVRYWNGNFSSAGAISFLKLHGSVDWFRFRPENDSSTAGESNDCTGIAVDGDHNHVRDPTGNLLTPLDSRPLLLIGTFNKISDYTRGIFRDLHYRFRSALRSAEQLVVCGYSFGDKAINSEVIDWHYADRGRQMVVIHPDPDKLAEHARGAIRNKWAEWQQAGSIKLLQTNLEQLDGNDLLDAIG